MERKRNGRPRKTDWGSLFAMAASLLIAGNYFINGSMGMGVLWLAVAALFFCGFIRRSRKI